MKWNGEEYSRRLEQLSDDTMYLISRITTCSSEIIRMAADIIMENDSEEVIAKKLRELLDTEE